MLESIFFSEISSNLNFFYTVFTAVECHAEISRPSVIIYYSGFVGFSITGNSHEYNFNAV